MSARKHLVADKGATFRLNAQVKDSEGVAVDLTGFEGVFTFVQAGVRAETTTVAGTDEGWVNILVTDEETAKWLLGKAEYTLDLSNPDGTVDRLLYGSVEVRGV